MHGLKNTLIIAAIVLVLAGQSVLAEDLAPNAPLISDLEVIIEDPPPYGTDWQGMAAALVHLKTGDRFSKEKLKTALDNLRLSKQFSRIHVDSKQGPDGMTLMFRLSPALLIKNVIIRGKYPLFERDISTALGIYPGDAYGKDRLAEQGPIVADLYRKEGFFDPGVTVSAETDAEDGYMIITIEIEKGPFLELDALSIDGNESFSDPWLKLKMKSWRASKLPGIAKRFIPKDLEADLEHLTAFYRKKGFADVKIESRIARDEAEDTVSAALLIEEGPHYDWDFQGNEAFWNYTLKKDVVLPKEGNRHNRGLSKSKKNLVTRYADAGYLDAKVTIEKEETGPSAREIRFVVNEGPQTKVASVDVRGNTAIDIETLKEQILTRPPGFLEKGLYSTDMLQEDIIAVHAAYVQEGYGEPKVEESTTFDPQSNLASVVLEINEGIQTKIASVSTTGVTAITPDQVHQVLQLKSGEPFRGYMVSSDENALAALISEKGYPHVSVDGNVVLTDDKTLADVVYRVDEGPEVRMGKTYYTGNFRTKDRILQNESEMAPGDTFSLVRFLKGQRNIKNLGIFNSVNFKTIGLKEKSDVIHVVAEVEENRAYYVESSLGYESDSGFYVDARIGDRNLFGTNKDVWFGAEYSQIGYRTELGLSDPRFMGTRISADYSLFAEDNEEFNQDFGSRGYGALLQFNKRYFKRLLAGLGFRFEQREQYKLPSWTSTPGKDESNLFDQRVFVVISPSISYDSRDSYVRPKKGIYPTASVDISKGIGSSLDDFVTYKLDFRYYRTPLPRVTMACLLRLGHIMPYGSSHEVPDDQLFFLGGTADIRGFDENELRRDATGDPLGGKTALAGSLEARIDLGKNFELTLFYDAGSLSNTSPESESDGFRHTAGGGIRYITPIGPIGFLYGVKLDKENGESAGRLHFSLGYTF